MENSKAVYSLPSNISYAIRAYWQERKSLLFYAAIGIVMRVALPFTSILMPKLVIDGLITRAAPSHFIATVGGMSIGLVVLHFLKSYTDVRIDENFGNAGSCIFPQRLSEKQIYMDYELLEDPAAQKLLDKAMQATMNNHTPACNLPRFLSELLVNIFGLLLYGSLIASIHPVILLLLALSALINWLMLAYARRYEKKTREERAAISRKIGYINYILRDRDMAKDMRLYAMPGWLMHISDKLMAEQILSTGKVADRNMLAQITDGLLILIRDGAAYALLLYLLLQKQIDLGSFVLMFAAIGSFAGWVSGILLQASELFRASSEMSDLRTFLDLPDRSNTGLGADLPPFDKAPEIRLEDTGYTYPGAETPALEHVDLVIRPGERIAIVGANGAGKTTLVKLICGLYSPTTGTVSLAGPDITTYNRDDYFSLFSAVFQDIHLLTTSIASNVSQQTPAATDRRRVEECLRRAGLYDKISNLPEGMDTLLVRQVNETATELSGGEKQKLALARALYRDAPVIILDEPTAALDPIAENEMYRQYAALTEGKTSIYISHRLASTRFCDRILLLDGHIIAEEGTHDELMRLAGKYAAMFATQASYYEQSSTTTPSAYEQEPEKGGAPDAE